MPKEHKPHRGTPASERGILTLTCILRLRVQPQVIYPLISDTILKLFPEPAVRLANKSASREEKIEIASEGKLAQYLEEKFDYAERWTSEPWKAAKEMDRGVVGAILRMTGLK